MPIPKPYPRSNSTHYNRKNSPNYNFIPYHNNLLLSSNSIYNITAADTA